MKKRLAAALMVLVMCLTCTLIPAQPAQAIAKAVYIDPESMSLKTGESQTIHMYVGGSVCKADGWSSSNKKVATVNSKGLVKAVGAGSATITCKTGFGYNLTCKVKVTVAKPGAPQKIKIQSGSYYTYWDKHRAELNKKGINQGDVYDAIISWDKGSKAEGYTVKIYWNFEGSKETSTVDVKKSGSKYIFSTTGGKYKCYLISKDEKTFITKGSSKKFTGTKLSFQVTGAGSTVHITKVVIKSYKVVNKKKVYSKAVTKKA